jgi:hypothetical protein
MTRSIAVMMAFYKVHLKVHPAGHQSDCMYDCNIVYLTKHNKTAKNKLRWSCGGEVTERRIAQMKTLHVVTFHGVSDNVSR